MIVSIAAGRWWFFQGHLFSVVPCSNKQGNVKWSKWQCLFCDRPNYSVRTEKVSNVVR